MKKYIAVLSLQVRSTIYKIAGIFVLLAAAEFLFLAVYLGRVEEETDTYFTSLQHTGEWERMSDAEKEQTQILWEIRHHNLGRAVDESHADPFFQFGMFGVIAVLSWAACREKSRYSMRRLSVKCRTVYFIWAVYHVLCLLLLFAWQLLLVFFMDQVLCKCSPVWADLPQRLFLSFYQNGLLHGLLPLADIARWLSNGFFLLAAGLYTVFVGYSTLDRAAAKGRVRIILPAIALGLMIALFARDIDFEGFQYGRLDLAVMLGGLFCIIWCLIFMLREKQE